MRIFARGGHGGGFHSGHGGRELHWSDFVSSDNGQPHYHLIPLLALAGIVFLVLLFLWLMMAQVRGTHDIPISHRALIIAGVILALLAGTCEILVRCPQFSFF